jgi:hypothetical protein
MDARQEISDALLALKLTGDNVIFFDRSAIRPQSIQALAEDYWQREDLGFEAAFIAVDVPRGKTLRGCVLRRNPAIVKLIRLWERLKGKTAIEA